MVVKKWVNKKGGVKKGGVKKQGNTFLARRKPTPVIEEKISSVTST